MAKAKRVGLPNFVQSKFDNHFVEEISARTHTPVVRNIPIQKILANDQQPRKDFGNLEELAESIKEKGVLEPILIRPKNGQFEIIAGERRYRASKLAGLTEIPCIEYDIADNEALEVSIIENIQRKDLTIYEHSFSLKSLSEIYGYTHQEIAQKISKSRVTVTELIRITDLPEEILERCEKLKISSKTFLLELVKLDSVEQMNEVLDNYAEKPFSREKIKELRKADEDVAINMTDQDQIEKNADKNEVDREDEIERELEKDNAIKATEGRKQENESTGHLGKAFRFNLASEDKSIQIKFDIKSEKPDRNQIIGILERLITDIKENRIKEFSIN